MLKKLLVPLLALGLLVAVPGVALADDDTTTPTAKADDPGIAALHDAAKDFRSEMTALRAECGDRSDKAKRDECKKKFRELRDSFKEARQAAIAKHHAFVEQCKQDRNESKKDASTRKPAR